MARLLLARALRCGFPISSAGRTHHAVFPLVRTVPQRATIVDDQPLLPTDKVPEGDESQQELHDKWENWGPARFHELAFDEDAVTETQPPDDAQGRSAFFGPRGHEKFNAYKEVAPLPKEQEFEDVSTKPRRLTTSWNVDLTPDDAEDAIPGLSPPQVPKQERDELGRGAASGSRKRARAHAKVWEAEEGEAPRILVNGKLLPQYFGAISQRETVLKPLVVTETLPRFNVQLWTRGGGMSGQAGAASLAIARAIQKYDPMYRNVLRDMDLVRRDPREVERKKPGQRKARKKFQWNRR